MYQKNGIGFWSMLFHLALNFSGTSFCLEFKTHSILKVCISQGCAATHLRYRGNFYTSFVENMFTFWLRKISVRQQTFGIYCQKQTATVLWDTVSDFNYTVSGKRGHVIFNYNSRISWSIFIIFILLETGMNTPQLHVIYLLKIFMTS